MKRIALLHTVKSVLNTFEDRLRQKIGGELAIHNLLDDFLASDANERGCFSLDNANRLFHDLKSLELTHPDVIVVTCSTLTPCVEQIRPFISVPIVAIDDAMTALAVTLGPNVHILATAQSTVEPTRHKLLRDAAAAGCTITVTKQVCDDAYTAMKAGDMEAHDRQLCEAALEIKSQNQNVVVLAQASMAHLEQEIQSICGCRVLSSPGLCVARVEELLTKGA